MTDGAIQAEAMSVKFTEAIEYLRNLLGITSEQWREIWAETKAVSDLVAKETLFAMQRDMMRAVLTAIEDGTTLEEFRTRYREILANAGWSDRPNQGWHSQMIFRMHTQAAYAAGRWRQAEEAEARNPTRPIFLRYVTVGDNRVRPNHAAWQGVILPLRHPWWQTHYPPCGFNCRCHAMVLTERSLARYGWTVTADSDPRLALPVDQGWDQNVGLVGARVRQLEQVPRKSLQETASAPGGPMVAEDA